MSFRRTWDKEYYEKKAKERAELGDSYQDPDETQDEKRRKLTREEFKPAEDGASGPMGSERAFLKSRENRIALDDKVGKVEIINPVTDANKVGFYCEVCSCLLKDSASYLDHINGKRRK